MSEKPWEDPLSPWKNKAQFFNWLRGNLRKAVWQFYPIKLEAKKLWAVPHPERKGWRQIQCALTGEMVSFSAAESDHIIGNVSLQDWSDVLPFIQHLCANSDELQGVSKEAHRVKSYAEKMGITFEEALLQKKAIEIIKSKKDVAWLKEQGYTPETNSKKRREQIIEILRGQQ